MNWDLFSHVRTAAAYKQDSSVSKLLERFTVRLREPVRNPFVSSILGYANARTAERDSPMVSNMINYKKVCRGRTMTTAMTTKTSLNKGHINKFHC